MHLFLCKLQLVFFSLSDLAAKYTLSSNVIGYQRTLATLNLPGTWSYPFFIGVPRLVYVKNARHIILLHLSPGKGNLRSLGI